MRNVFPERTRRGICLLSKSGFADAGTMGCVDVAVSVRRVAAAPGDGRPIASAPGSGHALQKVATPAQPPADASVPVSGPGEPVAVGATAKTASGGMRAVGASAGDAAPCD